MKLLLFFLLVSLWTLTINSDPIRYETRTYSFPDVIKTSENLYQAKKTKKTKEGHTVHTVYHLLRTDHFMKHKKNTIVDKRRSGINSGVEVPRCCNYIVPGAIIRQPIQKLLDPTNDDNLSPQQILSVFEDSYQTWQQNFETKLISNVTIATAPFFVDVDGLDGDNWIFWAVVNDPGVIAFTASKGIYNGPVLEVLEVDMVINRLFQIGFANNNPQLYHFPAIIDHETGHEFGLDHILGFSECSGSIMEASLGVGEIKNGITELDLQCNDIAYGAITGLGNFEGNVNDADEAYHFCLILMFFALLILF